MEVTVVKFEAGLLSRHSSEPTGGNQETINVGNRVPRARFEDATSRIRSKRVNYSNDTLR
jgi:hypothetical protein